MIKQFSVLINDKSYDVYDIEGKEHPGFNNTPKNRWVYYSDPLPDGIMPPLGSEHWVPYSNPGIERFLYEVRLRQTNRTKPKWDAINFSNSTTCEICCNGRKIYEFTTWGGEKGMAFAMAQAQSRIVQMSEHPFNFYEPQKENGRKIWWRGLPATIMVNDWQPWEIQIRPDYSTGLDKKTWWNLLRKRSANVKPEAVTKNYLDEDELLEAEDMEEHSYNGYINWGDALSDKYINWFRE